MRTLRALVVDDSAVNRRTLADLLTQIPGVSVVGVAQDGDEALRLAVALSPDLITLDLEMPRMDGFTFLRLLMASRPVPVLVISSHSAKENVFRALELGAIDFIAKPETFLTLQTQSVREQLDRMVAMVRQLSPTRPGKDRSMPPLTVVKGSQRTEVAPRKSQRAPGRLMVVAASTGGPTALLDLFSQLPSQSDTCIVVAQHMPERFTRAFAERLDRTSAFGVTEAVDGEVLYAQRALVCPGGKCIEVEYVSGKLICRVVEPEQRDRYIPSADRLFRSAARALGDRVIGVVLTGMGEDGARGVVEIKSARGSVYVESEETAVVYGMPRCAKATGVVDEALPLPAMVARLSSLIARAPDGAEAKPHDAKPHDRGGQS